MKTKAITGIMLTLLIGMLTLTFNIQAVEASETIYIRANGSVDPPTAPIQRDGKIYTFTDNIDDEIVVERDNIVVDGAGYTLEGTGAIASKGIALTGKNKVTIKNMEIKTCWYGIYLLSSFDNIITGNNITNNFFGIHLKVSSDNTISGNNVTANNHGVHLTANSPKDTSNNIISGNNITNNGNGIGLDLASNNIISGNNITNNSVGSFLDGNSNNIFYHNNFVDSTYFQVEGVDTTNVWDDGYPSGGNYWSDHVTVDNYSGINQDEPGSDGIVDEPYICEYIIDDDNIDNYPLVEPWSPNPLDGLEELVETIETWDLPKGIEKSLTSKLEGALRRLNKENENGAIRLLMAFINQVEALRDKKLTNEQASYLTSEAQRIIDRIKG